jgi:NAD/NADP transhydrogenase alpha subunit
MAYIKYPFGAAAVQTELATLGNIDIPVNQNYTLVDNLPNQKGAKRLRLVIDPQIAVGSQLDYMSTASTLVATSTVITFGTGFAGIATFPVATRNNAGNKRYTTMVFRYNGSAFVPMADPYKQKA